jgi:hypothetical protein
MITASPDLVPFVVIPLLVPRLEPAAAQQP